MGYSNMLLFLSDFFLDFHQIIQITCHESYKVSSRQIIYDVCILKTAEVRTRDQILIWNKNASQEGFLSFPNGRFDFEYLDLSSGLSLKRFLGYRI